MNMNFEFRISDFGFFLHLSAVSGSPVRNFWIWNSECRPTPRGARRACDGKSEIRNPKSEIGA